MYTSTTPEYMIGQMRVLTMVEQLYFYITNTPTPMSELDKDLNLMIPKLETAQALAGIAQVGPVIIRYHPVTNETAASQPLLYVMEIGVPIKPETKPAGEALIKTLPPFHCAALLYWGSLAHIAEAYGALIQAIKDAGLEQMGEGREWHYHFEGDTSPNNVLGLHIEIG
jgi:effector-binding domain-containing protein